jgi:glycolate oxidase
MTKDRKTMIKEKRISASRLTNDKHTAPVALNAAQIQEVTKIVGESGIFVDEKHLNHYGHDETEDLVFAPSVVVLPKNTHEVSQIMELATRHILPVTVRGAGTGLAGGALPIAGGILMSMEKFDQILEIDSKNFQVTTEPGVITEVLQNAVKELGLFYPPDPSSRGTSWIGGNVSTNAGGPRAVKYGVVKDHVLNLEVVLPSGKIIWTGANTLKNSTGYNLTQLLVGSEGTLGVITKIVLKLQPHPSQQLLMLAAFESSQAACAAVADIFKAGVTPSALEFMERNAIDWAVRYLGDVNLTITDAVQAHLLIEVDGHHVESLYHDCEKIQAVLERFGCTDVLFADNDAQKTDLWRLRRNVAHAVKSQSVYKEEDTVVPRAHLPALLAGVKEIGSKYGFESVCYGHAGDGNLHVNILRGDMNDSDWDNTVTTGIRAIFGLVSDLGGTLSGEHGIGYVQRPYMDILFSETELEIMRGIKRVFDPLGILNPGKIF